MGRLRSDSTEHDSSVTGNKCNKLFRLRVSMQTSSWYMGGVLYTGRPAESLF